MPASTVVRLIQTLCNQTAVWTFAGALLPRLILLQQVTKAERLGNKNFACRRCPHQTYFYGVYQVICLNGRRFLLVTLLLTEYALCAQSEVWELSQTRRHFCFIGPVGLRNVFADTFRKAGRCH